MTAEHMERPGPKYEGLRLKREFDAQRRAPRSVRKALKTALSYLPSSHNARLLAFWPMLREWKSKYLKTGVPEYSDRYHMWEDLIANTLPEKVAYLEFGCAAGNVVHWWADRVSHPDARFWGFDTFTGMPERWSGLGWTVAPGTWDQGGDLPVSEDARLSFVKGRFQDSLDSFIARETLFERDFDQYVIHIDADLYSAALYVLVMLRPLLPKAIVLFDEFDCALDELRALNDFCSAFYLEYEVLGTAASCEKIAIRFKFDS